MSLIVDEWPLSVLAFVPVAISVTWITLCSATAKTLPEGKNLAIWGMALKITFRRFSRVSASIISKQPGPLRTTKLCKILQTYRIREKLLFFFSRIDSQIFGLSNKYIKIFLIWRNVWKMQRNWIGRKFFAPWNKICFDIFEFNPKTIFLQSRYFEFFWIIFGIDIPVDTFLARAIQRNPGALAGF